MPNFLFLRGCPGSGKITVGRLLQRDLGWSLFWFHDLDRICVALGQHIRDVPELTNKIVGDVIEHMLANSKNIIFVRPASDWQSVESVRQQVVQHTKYRFHCVTLTAEYETLAKRVETRDMRARKAGFHIRNREGLDEYLAIRKKSAGPPAIYEEIATDNVSPEQTAATIKSLMAPGEPIAMVNGCFDGPYLHHGHNYLLGRAWHYGKILVAVNSDASVRRLKGDGRPVVPLAERMARLRALPHVHRVVAFSNEQELAIIAENARPNVMVKGSDYRDKTITGSQFASRVIFVERLPGYSTTELLAKR
jgi:rfaE bifunctional protein nucleotidyltransferase chain/domain